MRVSGYQPELPAVIRDSVKCAHLEFALGYLWEHLQITSGLAEEKVVSAEGAAATYKAAAST